MSQSPGCASPSFFFYKYLVWVSLGWEPIFSFFYNYHVWVSSRCSFNSLSFIANKSGCCKYVLSPPPSTTTDTCDRLRAVSSAYALYIYKHVWMAPVCSSILSRLYDPKSCARRRVTQNTPHINIITKADRSLCSASTTALYPTIRSSPLSR